MRKYILLFIPFFTLFVSSCHDEDNQYGEKEHSRELVVSGRLSESITDENILNISKLTINGTISGEDWNLLFRMAVYGRALEVLDMTNATISGVENDDSWNDNEIPAHQFSGSKALKEVFLPNSLKSIGEEAFSKCLKLTTIHFPEGIDSIAPRAFYQSGVSGEFNIPLSLRIIGRQAFAKTKISKVIINSNVLATKHSSIYTLGGNSVFADCEELTELVVKDGCTMLELGFQYCTSLKNVSLPQSLRYIGSQSEYTGNYIFNYCSALNSIKLPDSLTYIGYDAFSRTAIESVEFPSNVKVLNSFAFSNCLLLENVKLSDSLQIMEHGCFRQCAMLQKIEIPSSVLEIGASAFEDCTSLESVNMGESVVSIGSEAFMNCTRLKSIVLPSSVSSLGRSAFSGCTGLGSVILSNSLKNIESTTFYDCIELKNVIIGNAVESIGSSCFLHCPSLTELIIPSSVSSIAGYALSYTGLKNVTVHWISPLQIKDNVFEGTDLSVSTLKVPVGTKELYEDTPVWKNFGFIE
jgi:hypothetical protein